MRATLNKLFTLFFVMLLWTAIPTQAQTSVALSALGSFKPTTGNSVTRQVPSNSPGFMIELRHISSPLFGYDVAYSYRGADQLYEYIGSIPASCPGPACPTYVTSNSQPVNADSHALTLNWVVSLPVANFRVFALAGGGFENFNPTSSQAGGTQSQTRGVFDYGAGFDWTLLPHLGLRFQYRGNVFKAPQLATAFSSTDKFTQESEPMLGAYFNF